MTVEDEDRVAAVDVLPATAVPESRPADEDGGEDEGATTED
jgi:hypothetical protein